MKLFILQKKNNQIYLFGFIQFIARDNLWNFVNRCFLFLSHWWNQPWVAMKFISPYFSANYSPFCQSIGPFSRSSFCSTLINHSFHSRLASPYFPPNSDFNFAKFYSRHLFVVRAYVENERGLQLEPPNLLENSCPKYAEYWKNLSYSFLWNHLAIPYLIIVHRTFK